MIKCGDRDTQKSTNCVGNVNRGGRKMGESSFFFFDAHVEILIRVKLTMGWFCWRRCQFEKKCTKIVFQCQFYFIRVSSKNCQFFWSCKKSQVFFFFFCQIKSEKLFEIFKLCVKMMLEWLNKYIYISIYKNVISLNLNIKLKIWNLTIEMWKWI